MSERIYEEAWEYTMKVLHDLYKSQNKEDEFKLWFNMNYVEDTIDTITVSVASSFLQQTMQKKGNFDIVLKKLKEITGQEDIRLNCIVVKEELSESKKSESLNDEKPSKKFVEPETSSSNSNLPFVLSFSRKLIKSLFTNLVNPVPLSFLK